MRKGALYSTAYDEQIVWDNDYPHFIRQNIPDIVWLNVWGETAQEKESGYNLDNINRIFFSAYSDKKSQAKLEEEIMALFDELHRQGQTVVVVTHEPDIAAHCQRTIRVSDGRIVQDTGKPNPCATGFRMPFLGWNPKANSVRFFIPSRSGSASAPETNPSSSSAAVKCSACHWARDPTAKVTV